MVIQYLFGLTKNHVYTEWKARGYLTTDYLALKS